MTRTTLLCLLAASACAGPAKEAATPGATASPDLEDTAPDVEDSADSGSPAPTPACTDGPPLSEVAHSATCATAAPCSWSGAHTYDYLGYSADGGADFDGDGVDDVVLGELLSDAVIDGATAYDAGAALLLSGADLAAGGTGVMGRMRGTLAGAQAGAAVAFVGDLDGDGDSELLVGSRSFGDTLSPLQGAVHLVLGGPGDGDRTPYLSWRGSRSYGRGGSTVAGPGDLDGDGIPDLAASDRLTDAEPGGSTPERAEGRVVLASGASLEEGSLSDWPVRFDGAAVDQVAHALAGGDLNGDGYSDVAVGAPYAGATAGAVTVLYGGPTALTPQDGLLTDAGGAELRGLAPGDAFGFTVAVGDVVGDASPELIVGAPLHDAPHNAEGAVHVFSGTELVATRTGAQEDSQLGTGLVAGDDLDGDGQGDLVVGSVAAWHGVRTKSGRVYLLPGGDGLTGTAAVDDSVGQLYAPRADDYLGAAAATADVNSDGQADLIVSTAYANPDDRTDAGAVWLFFGG